LALFEWSSPNRFFYFLGDGFYYLLGEYARYVCAYGGLTATIFGAMLIDNFLVLRNLILDFLVLRASIANKRNIKRNAIAWLIRARNEWQIAKDFDKYCSMEPTPNQSDFFMIPTEGLAVVDQE
jgi:hypothetical protein